MSLVLGEFCKPSSLVLLCSPLILKGFLTEKHGNWREEESIEHPPSEMMLANEEVTCDDSSQAVGMISPFLEASPT